MANQYPIGAVLVGKVTGIQPYGAFVALDEETQGLVHISEIVHGYVKDVRDYLKIGDEVNVKILSVDHESGKISLSIKAVEEKSKPIAKQKTENEASRGFNTLREKLQEWIEQSKHENIIKK